jgi:hypothetical protein
MPTIDDDDKSIEALRAGENINNRGKMWRILRLWREDIMAVTENKPSPAPTSLIVPSETGPVTEETKQGYWDDDNLADRKKAFTEALAVTRHDPRFDTTGVDLIELAEYLRAGTTR